MPVCAKCEIGVGMDLFCPKCYDELKDALEKTLKTLDWFCKGHDERRKPNTMKCTLCELRDELRMKFPWLAALSPKDKEVGS